MGSRKPERVALGGGQAVFERHVVRHASEGFHIDRLAMGKLPFVLDRSGRVVLEVSAYVYERIAVSGASVGTVTDEAYVLAAWLDHLSGRDIGWNEASDLDLQTYKVARLNAGVGKARVRRSLSVIVRFSTVTPTLLGVAGPVVGEVLPGHPRPDITLRRATCRDGRERVTPRVGVGKVPHALPRPTPDAGQAEAVIDDLLERDNAERATVYWLCANLMYQSGLRRSGAACLRLAALAQALAKEGIRAPSGPYNLAHAADSVAVQDEIFEGLQLMRSRGTEQVFVLVAEKGGGPREVGVPINLFEHILFYIWQDRPIVAGKPAKLVRPTCGDDHVFLSLKTGKGLTPKSVGNVVKASFDKLGIAGSGHRLRAAFGERILNDAFQRARGAHGRAWDIETILLEASEKLGHRDTDSLRYYLYRILRETNLVPGTPVLITVPTAASMIRALVDEVNSGNAAVAQRLAQVLAEFGLVPREENASSLDIVPHCKPVTIVRPGSASGRANVADGHAGEG